MRQRKCWCCVRVSESARVQVQVRPAQMVCIPLHTNALGGRKVAGPAGPKKANPRMPQRGRAQAGQRDRPAPRRRR